MLWILQILYKSRIRKKKITQIIFNNELERIVRLQNKCIMSLTEDINNIFDSKIDQLNILIEEYNIKLKEIEEKLNQNPI